MFDFDTLPAPFDAALDVIAPCRMADDPTDDIAIALAYVQGRVSI